MLLRDERSASPAYAGMTAGTAGSGADVNPRKAPWMRQQQDRIFSRWISGQRTLEVSQAKSCCQANVDLTLHPYHCRWMGKRSILLGNSCRRQQNPPAPRSTRGCHKDLTRTVVFQTASRTGPKSP